MQVQQRLMQAANWSFTGLATGNYTVTPSKPGYTFSPSSSAQTVSNANITGVAFTAATATGMSLFDALTREAGATPVQPAATIPPTPAHLCHAGQWCITDIQSGSISLTQGQYLRPGLSRRPAQPKQCSSSVSTLTGQITISSGVAG